MKPSHFIKLSNKAACGEKIAGSQGKSYSSHTRTRPDGPRPDHQLIPFSPSLQIWYVLTNVGPELITSFVWEYETLDEVWQDAGACLLSVNWNQVCFCKLLLEKAIESNRLLLWGLFSITIGSQEEGSKKWINIVIQYEKKLDILNRYPFGLISHSNFQLTVRFRGKGREGSAEIQFPFSLSHKQEGRG